MIVENYYDAIHPTECFLEEPQISGGTMVIPARNIGIFPGHPLNSASTPIFLAQCRLVYTGVKSSVRTIHEYAGDPKQDGFMPPRTVHDGPFISTSGQTKLFELEGTLERPFAWVDWDIESTTFHLEI